MGLDNIWVEPKGQKLRPVTFNPPLQLATGYFTDPATSFRGKRYADLVHIQTGVCLYNDLSNREVMKAADRLDKALVTLTDLARMFRQFGDAGYELIAWF